MKNFGGGMPNMQQLMKQAQKIAKTNRKKHKLLLKPKNLLQQQGVVW